AAGDLGRAEATALADRVAATVPRFATQPHNDPRAPQNLHPIAGLERELRRRLGDQALLERALREAAANGTGTRGTGGCTAYSPPRGPRGSRAHRRGDRNTGTGCGGTGGR